MIETRPLALDHYVLLGKSGLRVSPICLGAMTFGTDWGWGADREGTFAMLDSYAAKGGNFIDTANFYTNGSSETLLGDWLQGRREQTVLATKYTLNMRKGDPNGGGNHRKCMVQSVEASLKRLNTDYIDLLWLHIWDDRTPVEEIMRAFDDLVRAGKILYAGISDAPAWRVAQMNTIAELRGWTPFIGLQISYSLAERTVEHELIPMANALGLGVTPWSPLAGGLLTGKYNPLQGSPDESAMSQRGKSVGQRLTEKNAAISTEVQRVALEVGRSASQVALAWLLHRPGGTIPIIGARTLTQMEDNLGAVDLVLSAEQLERLDRVSAVEPIFPNSFLAAEFVQNNISGGAKILK